MPESSSRDRLTHLFSQDISITSSSILKIEEGKRELLWP